jgi:polysaccharide biosynthesis transport protein
VLISETDDELQTEPSEEVSLSEVVEVLNRRRRVIYGTILVAVIVGVALSLLPPRYKAEGTIRIQPEMGEMYRTSPLSLLSGEASDKIVSEVTVIQSRTLYLEVAKQLDLVNTPAFWGKRKLKERMSLDDPETRDEVVRALRKDVDVVHDNKGEIINLDCTTISPQLSAKIINAIINQYLEDIFRMRSDASQRASGWLISQLDDLKRLIDQDQSQLAELQSKLNVIGLNPLTAEALSTESLVALTRASTAAQIDRIIAEAKLRRIQSSDPNLLEGGVNLLQGPTPVAAPNGLLQNLRNSQAQLAANYSRLRAQFGVNYPDVKQAKAQLDEITREVTTEQNRILNQAQLSYTAASANERATAAALNKEKNDAFSSSHEAVKYIFLLNDYDSHRTLYEGLVLRLREAGITAGMEAGDIDIVDLADLPGIPSFPGPLAFIVLSIPVGLILGIILAFVVEAMKTRVTTLEQAERASRLSSLALLPHVNLVKRTQDSQAVPHQIVPQNSRYEEAIQALRNSILLSRPGERTKVVLVTSAVPGEGKSTISMNLTAVFARHNQRALLIDCDLRRGELAARLGLSTRKGLSNVLTDNATLEESVQDVPGVPGMQVLGGGPRPPNPAVLTGSPQMRLLIERCRQQYDMVVLDSSPILGISDTVNLAQSAETIILIIRNKISSNKAIKHTRRIITSARLSLLGFVFNDVDAVGLGYGYGAYYENYYRSNEGGKSDL